ncbi:hypothetical protein Btru_076941 [Bulinus truncatus]|nr:hypothetical protein Btru_076941 [Bulinus truncatus]
MRVEKEPMHVETLHGIGWEGGCKNYQYACSDGRCIAKEWVCDGDGDCSSGEDEKTAKTHTVCSPSRFQCTNRLCIDEALLCNGNDDCGDNSDEPSACGIDECKSKRPVCSQICIEKKIGYECKCHPGYQFQEVENVTGPGNSSQRASQNRKCIDIDECSTTYPCSHYCKNTIGGFKCSCADGYTMLSDGICAVADGSAPGIQPYYLRLIGTSKNNVTTFTS